MDMHHDTGVDSANEQALLVDRVFDGRAWHRACAVLIAEGRIRGLTSVGEIPSNWSQRRLPTGAILCPGFIDLQVNGGGGVLFNDEPTVERMQAIACTHRRFGTTACLPTIITDTREKMRAAIAAARAASGREGVLGLHLEGPFINPARPGVHRTDHIVRAEESDLEWLLELRHVGRSLVTLAPECVPADFVRKLTEAGICVSAGHSEATVEVMTRAIHEGLTGVTHLYNAMPPLSARAPGLVGVAMAEPSLTASLIVDGVHVHPAAVRAAFAAKKADRIALVTDAMPSVGTDLANFDLLGRTIALRNGRLMTEDGRLAGAHLDMTAAVRNAVTLAQVSLGDALRAATLTPAQFLGVDHEHGTIKSGARADLVALTADLRIFATWMGGKRC